MSAIFENYLDAECFPGTTFYWNFQLVPLDITGGSAVLLVDFVEGPPVVSTSFTVTCTPTQVGSNAQAQFALTVPAATTAAWATGLYDYRLLVTLSDGTTQIVVTGMLCVKQYGYGV